MDLPDIDFSNNIEKYLNTKIQKLVDLNNTINTLQESLTKAYSEKRRILQQEMEDFRKQTGVNHIISKSKGLSKQLNTLQSNEET